PIVGTTMEIPSTEAIEGSGPGDRERPEREQVDRGRPEQLHRLPGGVHHRPPGGVQRGVDHHRQAGTPVEARQHRGGQRIGSGATASPPVHATCSAAPRAVPASPAAGCTHNRRYGPCADSRALATQLSATPPAMASAYGPPAASYSQPARSRMTSSSRAWTL